MEFGSRKRFFMSFRTLKLDLAQEKIFYVLSDIEVDSIMASGRTMVLWAREWRGVDCIACFGMVHAVLMASLPRGQGRWWRVWRTR
jgi:hypothetical protein